MTRLLWWPIIWGVQFGRQWTEFVQAHFIDPFAAKLAAAPDLTFALILKPGSLGNVAAVFSTVVTSQTSTPTSPTLGLTTLHTTTPMTNSTMPKFSPLIFPTCPCQRISSLAKGEVDCRIPELIGKTGAMLGLDLGSDPRLIRIVLWWIVLFGRNRGESWMERVGRRLTVLRRRLRDSGGKHMRRSRLLMRIRHWILRTSLFVNFVFRLHGMSLKSLKFK
jgi:hypothetical protein